MTKLLEKLSQYHEVIALKGSDYEGLRGKIEEIMVGSERQTENDCEADIVVTFEEHSHEPIESSHPNLNGTSIADVIMGEDELGFFINNEVAITIEGKIVCLECYHPLDSVDETQYDDITWSFNAETGTYEKHESSGSEGKKCPLCNCPLEIYDEEILKY